MRTARAQLFPCSRNVAELPSARRWHHRIEGPDPSPSGTLWRSVRGDPTNSRAAVSVLVGLSSALVLASCAITPAGPGEVDANLSYVLLGLYSEEYPINHVMLREVDTGEGIKARRDTATNLILTSLPPGRYRLSRLSFGRPPEDVRLEGAPISFEPGYVYYLADIIMPRMTPAELQNGWMTWARAHTVVRVSGLGTPLPLDFSFERRATTIAAAIDAYPELFAVFPIVISGQPRSALPR